MSETLPNSTSMLTMYDTSIPSKREIRKLAKRCPSLRVLRWAGRLGKGEWHLSHSKSATLPVIDFVPMSLVDGDEEDRDRLGTGADVERFITMQRHAHPIAIIVSCTVNFFHHFRAKVMEH